MDVAAVAAVVAAVVVVIVVVAAVATACLATGLTLTERGSPIRKMENGATQNRQKIKIVGKRETDEISRNRQQTVLGCLLTLPPSLPPSLSLSPSPSL